MQALTQRIFRSLVAVMVCGAGFWALAGGSERSPKGGERPAVDFARDVRPILQRHCYQCHGAKRQESGLRLSSRDSALAGGDSGQKAIVPGKPEESRLIKVVSGKDGKRKMPPPGKAEPLAPEEIDLLVRWVAEGANWPEQADAREAGGHWAWQEPVQRVLPSVKQADWPRNRIDYFVLARLEREGLAPSPEADRYTLCRRVYLDLIGLPPSPQEVEAFVSDTRPDAYGRLVDRLLADPGYGERWARMWLDLARYADSKGYGSDPLRTIWRYRDWVIEAFNRNVPYDRFTIEQLAGDLLPVAAPSAVPPLAPPSEGGEGGGGASQGGESGVEQMGRLIATAFHRNTMSNDEGGTDDEEFRVAAIKDRVDTTAQIWMGLTVGCAKCHSHKYDPITQREYYQFFALFNQTEDADRNDEEPKLSTPMHEQRAELARLAGQIAEVRKQFDTPTPELAAAQQKWEAAVAAQEAQWVVLEPQEWKSAGGATLEKLGDHSVMAGGTAPETDTYTIVAPAELKGITAIRLELLPHESLPKSGPGRQPESGAFVLNDFRVAAVGKQAKPIRGRFVRIELPGSQRILSLAEVQVFRGNENVALKGKATQSSTDYEGPANLAIDNNTDGHYFDAKSTTHTRLEDNPWWEVDLGAEAELKRVVIWNRTDGDLQSRLSNFRLVVLDEAHQPVWEQALAEPPNPSDEIEPAEPARFPCENPTADFSQEGWPIARAVDADAGAKSGWAVAPQMGKAHVAVFPLARPIDFEGGAVLTFTLAQSHGAQHTIGRLRLSATTATPPPPALPGYVSDILAVPTTNRTPEQSATLAGYYRSIAPELQGVRAAMAKLEEQRKTVEKAVPTTPILRELPPDKRRATHVLLKGNFLTTGDAVEPAVPQAFHPLPKGVPADRLGLALWLVSKENPLTARVAVNRFWGQLFGRGLVESEEDFGTQGSPPSHPELLDWLAVEFMNQDWDMKALLRLIVASATYRQSSRVRPELLQKDPDNRLVSRGSRFRLEAEMVRDQALALAGLLSRKVGGPSVYPPQPPGLWRAAFNGDRTWPTSTGEDRYRRGLYTFWRRTVPYPSMATFDAPSREICTMRRAPTNTPLQAFVTLNDPVYVEAAQALARRMVREGGGPVQDRAAYGLRLCLGRPPEQEQVDALAALYDRELAHYGQDSAAATQMATDPLGPLPEGMDTAEAAAWTVVSNVLLNLDGVLTKR